MREEFAHFDIRSAQNRLVEVENVLKWINCKSRIIQPDWVPSKNLGVGLFYRRQEYLQNLKTKQNLKPVAIKPIDFEHIPSLLRKRYAETWLENEFTRDEKDRQRELAMLDAVRK